MASRKPLVNVAGALSEVPNGDTLVVGGEIRSTSGGFRFPDNSIQTTAATGSGSSLTTGVTEANFGAIGSLGTSELAVGVTGQAGITSSKYVTAKIELVASSDHSIETHRYAATLLGITTGNIVDGVGFTIYLRTLYPLTGKFNIRWMWQ